MGYQYPKTTPLQQAGFAIITGLPLLAACFVVARLYARRRFNLRLDWDDYVIIIATLLSIALIYPSYRHLQIWHFGFHIWQVDPRKIEPDYHEYQQLRLAYNIINTPILPLVKISIILLLLKVGKLVKSIRRILYGLLFFITGSFLGPWVAQIFLCEPRTGRTTTDTIYGNIKCLGNRDTAIIYIWLLVVNMFTDLLILPIPNILMYRVKNITTRARMTVFVVSLLMLGATAIAATRLALETDHLLHLKDDSDWTHNIRFTLQHAENNVAIMLACMPMLRTLVLRWDRPAVSTQSVNSTEPFRVRRDPGDTLRSWDEVIDPPPQVETIACGLHPLPPTPQSAKFDEESKKSRLSSERSFGTELEFVMPEPQPVFYENGKPGVTRFYDSEPDF